MAAYISPAWFYGYDAAFQLLFAVITLIIAAFSFKVYKASEQRPARLLGFAFLFISLAFLVQALLSALLVSGAQERACDLIGLTLVGLCESVGILLHIALMLTGLALLVLLAVKPAGKRTLLLLLGVTLIALAVSGDALLTYYLLSSFFLAFISWHFIENYLSNKQTKTLLVALAFLFLFFGSFHFLLAVNHEIFYVLGHFLELAAYLLILANLYVVRKS